MSMVSGKFYLLIIVFAAYVDATFFRKHFQEEPEEATFIPQENDCLCECPKSKYVRVEVPQTQVKYYPIEEPKEESSNEKKPEPFKPEIQREIYKEIGDVFEKLDNLSRKNNENSVQYMQNNGFDEHLGQITYDNEQGGIKHHSDGSEGDSNAGIDVENQYDIQQSQTQPQQPTTFQESSQGGEQQNVFRQTSAPQPEIETNSDNYADSQQYTALQPGTEHKIDEFEWMYGVPQMKTRRYFAIRRMSSNGSSKSTATRMRASNTSGNTRELGSSSTSKPQSVISKQTTHRNNKNGEQLQPKLTSRSQLREFQKPNNQRVTVGVVTQPEKIRQHVIRLERRYDY